MPKMRRRNVRADDLEVSPYLICGKRHNQPRIHFRICEESCRNIKKCVFYKSWCLAAYKDGEKSKAKELDRGFLKDAEDEKFSKVTKRKYYKAKTKKPKRIKKIKTKEI